MKLTPCGYSQISGVAIRNMSIVHTVWSRTVVALFLNLLVFICAAVAVIAVIAVVVVVDLHFYFRQ